MSLAEHNTMSINLTTPNPHANYMTLHNGETRYVGIGYHSFALGVMWLYIRNEDVALEMMDDSRFIYKKESIINEKPNYEFTCLPPFIQHKPNCECGNEAEVNVLVTIENVSKLKGLCRPCHKQLLDENWKIYEQG